MHSSSSSLSLQHRLNCCLCCAGVAEPCLSIQQNEKYAYEYTAKGHLVGVITNGTAVLGLGNIGPLAGATTGR
jgi:malate dehydrogenase (oxaloacetate-decarboxylating)(NADP+)